MILGFHAVVVFSVVKDFFQIHCIKLPKNTYLDPYQSIKPWINIIFIDITLTNHVSSQGFKLKVEKILKGSLDSIPPPSPSVKFQIMGGKVCLRCKGKTLLSIVNKLSKTKSLLTSPSNVLPYYLKETLPPIIWIFTEDKGDDIKSRLSS